MEKEYNIIGNMTGNSMDAIDLVLINFKGDIMTCKSSYSRPFPKEFIKRMETFRREKAGNKTREEIEAIPEFRSLHNEYIQQVAECINEMCRVNHIDKSTVDAIGFHGKTLDHNPPKTAKQNGTQPYTLQIGSGQMLADMTGIRVIYDFRSAPLMAGFEGAPLMPPHDAHIHEKEGDGCYYNGGNTSNFSWVVDGKIPENAYGDAGPFNEYVDNFIRIKKKGVFDKDGQYGLKGTLNEELLRKVFDLCRDYYERPLTKSNDPNNYETKKVFEIIEKDKVPFNDAVRTLEYASAYVAVHALTLTPKGIKLPPSVVLFGGGWKNKVTRSFFEGLLKGEGYVMPEHRKAFDNFLKRFDKPISVRYSDLGEYREAELFADLARYKLENKEWEIPEIESARNAARRKAEKEGVVLKKDAGIKKVVCGVIAEPKKGRKVYTDCINLAAKGWQKREQNLQCLKLRNNARQKG